LCPDEDITRLLKDLNQGREGAEEALMPHLYGELRAWPDIICARKDRGTPCKTTALVHEAYLRLGGGEDASWENRAHYLRMAARAMRHILIDHARRKRSDKKGGKRSREPLNEGIALTGEPGVDLLALDEALNRLAAIDGQMVQVVELRFFGGLSVEETARVMSISKSTVKHEWMMAKAWLKQEL